MTPRIGEVRRATRETTVTVRFGIDGGKRSIATGIGFLDHLLDALATRAGFGLEVQVEGDLHVDDHHTVEDAALALGTGLDQALGDRRGVRRFGSAYAPLDDALAWAEVDLSGRQYSRIDLQIERERLGTLSCDNIPHALASFASTARITLHVDMLAGVNDHHKAEAAFKSVALALRDAVTRDGSRDVPSTKGTLT